MKYLIFFLLLCNISIAADGFINLPSRNGGLSTSITSAQNNDVLRYNYSTSKWVNDTISDILGYTPANTASLSSYELLSNKATDFSLINDTLYPTINAVSNFVDAAISSINLSDYEQKSNKATDFSTVNDVLYPTIKAVSDNITARLNVYVPGNIFNQSLNTFNDVTFSSATITHINSIDYNGYIPVNPSALSSYELLSNKATDFSTVNDVLYPTIKAVSDNITSRLSAYTPNNIFNQSLNTSDSVTFQSASAGTINGYVLPSTDGSSDYCIKTNGSKVLSFGECGTGGGGGLTFTNVSATNVVDGYQLSANTDNIINIGSTNSNSPFYVYLPDSISAGDRFDITSNTESGFALFNPTTASASVVMYDDTQESSSTSNTLISGTDRYGSVSLIAQSSSKLFVKSKNGIYPSIDYLIVAGGGGGGGYYYAGGGGAGGVIYGTTSIKKGTYAVVVGNGGNAGTSSTQGQDGYNSSFNGLNAIGGGGGGTSGTSAGRSGGSGGGTNMAGINGQQGAGTTGQGNSGGYGGTLTGGGGGGGASAAGANATTAGTGGKGGDGIFIFGNYYAGGGGGAGYDVAGGYGGLGGGGRGGWPGTAGANATANTGGGGGGASGYNGGVDLVAGAGGSGVVVIRYWGPQRATGGTVTSSGGYTYHTFTSDGNFIL